MDAIRRAEDRDLFKKTMLGIGLDTETSLVVDKSGQTFLNDKPVALDALARQLAQTASQSPDTEVQLRADQAVPYGKVVQVMGVAQKAGLNRIGFVADPTPAAAVGTAAGR